MGSTGDMLKASVEAVRATLGYAASITRTDASVETLAKRVSFAQLQTGEAMNNLGIDYQDEANLSYAMIEAPAGTGAKVGEMFSLTGCGDWLVRQVKLAVSDDVVIGERCVCVRKMVG